MSTQSQNLRLTIGAVMMAGAILGAALAFPASGQQQPTAAQQRAMVEAQIAKLPPSVQAMARAEMERKFAEQKAAAAKPKPVEIAEHPSTPADEAYMRKQWEPVIRKGFQAQKAFDKFMDDTMAAKCPQKRSYARYGSAWRYELQDISPNWVRGADSEENTVTILGPTYAPKDGRYDFDFSQVRYTFDTAKVEAAIVAACAEFKAAGEDFYKGIDPLIAAKNWDAAYKYEQKAQGRVGAIDGKLNKVVEAQNPHPINEIMLAMIQGKRIG